jgi:RNA polymerase sigma factor (sigma-70 family)
MTREMAKPLPPFQAFLDEHRGPVLSFLRSMVGHSDADDVFQETFIAAMRAYDRLDGEHPRAWVITIARRKAIDHFRARARRPEPHDELPEQVSHDANPGEGGGGPQFCAAVAGLPPKQRDAVALRYAADLAYADIAAAIDSSEEAARQSVHEGLKKLRKSAAVGEERG